MLCEEGRSNARWTSQRKCARLRPYSFSLSLSHTHTHSLSHSLSFFQQPFFLPLLNIRLVTNVVFSFFSIPEEPFRDAANWSSSDMKGTMKLSDVEVERTKNRYGKGPIRVKTLFKYLCIKVSGRNLWQVKNVQSLGDSKRSQREILQGSLPEVVYLR